MSQFITALSILACLLYLNFRPRKKDLELPPKMNFSNPWLLFLVSVAGLYIELLLIRWIGTEIRLFAYVQNLVLISCFLGFGVGCYRSSKPGSLLPVLDGLVILTLFINLPWPAWQEYLKQLSNLLTLSPDSALWGGKGMYVYTSTLHYITSVVCAVAVVAIMLWVIATLMMPLGRWVGYCFDHSKNVIKAYSVNLAGSLIGTWVLVLLSVVSLPPPYWIALAFFLVLLATPKAKKNWITGAICLVPTVLIVFAMGQDSTWSPYQKLTFYPLNKEGEYFVSVNNTSYMSMYNTQPDFLRKHPDITAHYKDTTYDSPFRFIKPHPDVLIVGAGAGNDASAALRNGAAHVDAVEIDPVIYHIGKEMHADRPYADPKVNVIINDARNFLRRTDKRYDAIIFGLLDSQTEASGYSNIRVDNYVYTKQSFEQARNLLKPDGVMVLKFEVREPWTWIGQRFYRLLTEVFGHEPMVYRPPTVGNMWSGTVFLESNSPAFWQPQPDLKNFIEKYPAAFPQTVTGAPEPTTDDWPYAYNRGRTIPQTYLTISVILMLLTYGMVRRDFRPKERQTWVMFLLGAGFMLMETQLVSRLCLYFGTTWIVNSIAVSTVLAVLVLANVALETVKKNKDIRLLAYTILILSLLANFFVPWEQLPYSSATVGLILSAAFAVSIFMAGIIFTTTLQKAEKKSSALGANVMGAVFGGLAQNLSFIIGLKALLPVAAILYGASAFVMKGKAR